MMIPRIKNINDVVDWGLCVGCGACFAVCQRPEAVSMVNVDSVGARPRFNTDQCKDCVECLAVCPGYRIDAGIDDEKAPMRTPNLLIGPTCQVWEGHAADQSIRYNGSSGGILTALALFALEKEKMAFVLHTGMDPDRPWMNKTVISRNRDDLMRNAGSRYCTSSPCEMLGAIEESDRPCVFIGKPCDAAAVAMARKRRPRLDKNLGLVLSFFCAGTPSTNATLDLLNLLKIKSDEVNSLRYRGEGWPGHFKVLYGQNLKEKKIPYIDSWSMLAKQRPFRCHICPDGLGELADITSGDAWNRYDERSDNYGLSHVLARSTRGHAIVERAISAGYVTLKKSSPAEVIQAQGLVSRRKKVFGRTLAMGVLCIPTTSFEHFHLFKVWRQNNFSEKLRTILGTLRRIIRRGLWRRKPLF